MNRIFALTLIVVIPLTFATCSKTPENNLQHEPSGTSVTETISDATSIPENNAARTGASSSPLENDAMIDITVNGSVFSANLYNNESARTLLKKLPMTLNMSELNSNEKYYYLPDNLPTDSQGMDNINAGDLMLYGSNCLVLFYESFSTSYRYTKLGYIEDASGLAAALGSGSVKVTFVIHD